MARIKFSFSSSLNVQIVCVGLLNCSFCSFKICMQHFKRMGSSKFLYQLTQINWTKLDYEINESNHHVIIHIYNNDLLKINFFLNWSTFFPLNLFPLCNFFSFSLQKAKTKIVIYFLLKKFHTVINNYSQILNSFTKFMFTKKTVLIRIRQTKIYRQRLQSIAGVHRSTETYCWTFKTQLKRTHFSWTAIDVREKTTQNTQSTMHSGPLTHSETTNDDDDDASVKNIYYSAHTQA